MVQIQNVNFKYSGKTNLFEELSIELEAGRVYGFLGKNGTGKSTLIKVMAGLLAPHSGGCFVEGEDVFQRLPSVMRNIFVVAEDFQLPAIKMEQYVSINSPFYPKFNYKQYQLYRKEFELPDNKKLNTLSFGQRKKFLLAFGLATNVRLLLLDEPTNGLDIPSKSQLRKAVALALHDDMTVVISTHQARDLDSIIDSILIIEDGSIVFNQGCNEVTDKLSFEKTPVPEDIDKIIYKEETLGGYKIVRKAYTENETMLDLELLFNAVVANHDEINKVFKN